MQNWGYPFPRVVTHRLSYTPHQMACIFVLVALASYSQNLENIVTSDNARVATPTSDCQQSSDAKRAKLSACMMCQEQAVRARTRRTPRRERAFCFLTMVLVIKRGRLMCKSEISVTYEAIGCFSEPQAIISSSL